MKKILLFALTAFAVSGMNAQSIGTKTSKVKMMRPEVSQQTKKVSEVKFSEMKIGRYETESKTVKPLALNKNTIKSISNKHMKAAASNRAGEFAEYYDGTCKSNNGSESWVATPVTITDQNNNQFPGFSNILPNPFARMGLPEVLVTYTIDGSGNITVPAQYVCTVTLTSGEDVDVYINSNTATSVDGSFNLTLGADGTLTCETPYLAYYVIPEGQEFSMDGALGYLYSYNNVKYVAAGKDAAPVVSYDTNEVILYSGITDDAYAFEYQHVLVPAYNPVSFVNLTSDPADSWSWSVSTLKFDETANDGEGDYVNDEVVATADTRDFSFNTIGGELYSAPVLIGVNKELVSEPFVGAEENALVYAGAICSKWVFEDGRAPIVSKANLSHGDGLTGITTASASSEFKSLIFYQGKPSAPLYFEGVNMLLYNFNKTDNFTLTCKIQKVTRSASGSLTMGEVIAESYADTENIVPSSWDNTAQINFNTFSVKDVMGFNIPLDYIFMEDEFAIVIEGWNNGTFTGMAIGSEGLENGNSSIYLVLDEEEEYSGYYLRYTGNAFVGFNGAAYGYLHTEDNTDVTIDANGGQASIHIEPMLVGISENDGAPTTYIQLDDDTEIPEWLEVKVENEKYTDEDYESGNYGFDLEFSANALPAGTESREAEITFIQPGAKLTVKVTQSENGGTDGITTTVTKVTENGKAYNLSGRQVKAGQKGLIIRDGKKYIVK